MSQTSSEREQGLNLAYINMQDLHDFYLSVVGIVSFLFVVAYWFKPCKGHFLEGIGFRALGHSVFLSDVSDQQIHFPVTGHALSNVTVM